MKIHEYQAKELFKQAGIPVPEGEVVETPGAAYDAAKRIGKPVVVKAQVLVGGRGKAGGVKLAKDPDEAKEHASSILGMDIKGLKVDKVLVTEAVDIATEIYIGMIMDRSCQKPLVMASAEGGVEIEVVAKENPEAIMRLHVDPLFGVQPFQSRGLASKLNSDFNLVRQIAQIIEKLYTVYDRADASLAEINPLVITKDGRVVAIDAKVNIDDSALYRQKKLEELRDVSAEDPGEVKAREAGLSFVKLEGNVGCIVNGAGLAMATMDLIKTYGGEPANFLDIGGSSNPEKVIAALEIILRDPNVKSIFINIFGGITRCDDVAKGLVTAFKQMNLNLPVIVRLTGTNEDIAREILAELNLDTAATMDDGVKRAIELARS
ncbi:MAG: ADP-forming succinate--CoA ligase subunit beta [Candidatus Latescibacteria bacterium]|nr:ADP-forming succinate--CoA ligase subunit beta [Candidatus Latescibacterota bacterium]NIM20986.1 ADP-forming succinate--CoA ligase subunit beta [Candidatus Latescibacterota bacterium]NIM65121.1 ADP-forming succinate--CoA ligase subunit beta [Candidatus Latescibacterota bacterium]NIO01636.1 ADP-forming succinate--CoA ligase subunit beta [Candidatus Latescibacterota bacterium]NIO28153.1 ADP-forming succinate--CoA ligase subunit beta [Candidatus Latescibacterota bacterium]